MDCGISCANAASEFREPQGWQHSQGDQQDHPERNSQFVLESSLKINLLVGEHGGRSPLADNQHSSSLTSVPFQVPTQTLGFGFLVGIFPFGRTKLWQESHEAEPVVDKLKLI